jgi:hypothetical protein
MGHVTWANSLRPSNCTGGIVFYPTRHSRISRFTKIHLGLRVEFVMNDEGQALAGNAIDSALCISSLINSAAPPENRSRAQDVVDE